MDEGDTSGDLSLDRLVFFSDAVFAIAITLLVLELDVPNLAADATPRDGFRALYDLGWSLFAFALSFLVIGRVWMGHHAQFRTLRHFDARLMWPNLLYLMAVAFMPFASAFLGRNLGHFVPALVYNLTMVVMALMAFWVSRVIARVTGQPGNPYAGLGLILAGATCIALTFWIPILSQWGMATMPVWTRLENRLYSARPA